MPAVCNKRPAVRHPQCQRSGEAEIRGCVFNGKAGRAEAEAVDLHRKREASQRIHKLGIVGDHDHSRRRRRHDLLAQQRPAATRLAIENAAGKLGLAGPLTLRMTNGEPFVTDGGHFIVDASFGRIPDTRALSNALFAIPGVVEHGLFLGMADTAIVAGAEGARTLHAIH
jgi:hypothetical protein